jgi:hypothetical protein
MLGDKEMKVKDFILFSICLVILTIMMVYFYNRMFNINVIKSDRVITPIMDIRGNDTTFIYRGYFK